MENKEKLGQEPAFPNECARWLSKDEELIISGMSKRFYAACAAMRGLLSNPNISNWVSEDKQQQRREIAITAFSFADELLKREYE